MTKETDQLFQPPSDATQEIRFAVVMYGGVSLAIYINGVAQELLRLVRSTAKKSSAEISNTERVYRKLNYLLADKERSLERAEHDLKSNKPVCTRFVVDILAGTSAGGINGIYLAKALANGQNMDELRRLWVKEGDIALLINDKKSVEKPLSVQDPPESLLNSRRMYVKLLSALAGMDGVNLNSITTKQQPPAEGAKDTADECDSPFVEEIDLFVTTTDIQGVPLPIRLADDVVFERRHRNVFHFIYSADGGRNDFMERYNPFLAYAARCTSSFPFAFEPMRLCDIDDILNGFNYYSSDKMCGSGSERWQRFFKDYLSPTGIKAIPFPERSFGDGGYLDNKPFTYATDTLMRRNADVPVDRKLIYIEPSPEHPEDDKERAERPDFLKNAMAALLTLPRYETIREDLQRVMERNGFIRRLNRIVHGVERDVDRAVTTDDFPMDDAAWAKLDLAEMVDRKGRGYAGYHRLEIAAVTDGLAELIARVARFDNESDYFLAIRCLVRAWRDSNYAQYHDEGLATMNEFLWSFNMGYPIRRLNFLRSRIDDLHDLDEQARQVIELRCPEFWPRTGEPSEADKKEFRRELLSIKTELNKAFKALLKELRILRSPGNPKNPLRDSISKMGIGSEELDYILGKRELQAKMKGLASADEAARRGVRDPDQFEEECVERARTLIKKSSTLTEALQKVRDELSSDIKRVKKEAEVRSREALKEDSEPPELRSAAANARACVRYYYDQYDNYDMITFPILYGTDIGESDVVEIIRISPEDAKTLINERKVGCLKLAGTALGHFGAFLEGLWRENDILWGRLDGAERIITAMLPDDPEQARELIADAQAAIVSDAINEKGEDELKQLLIESMMRTGSGAPDADAFSEFLNNLLGEVADPSLKATLQANIKASQLRDFYLNHYAVNSKLRPEPTLRSAARATTVIGKMLEGLSDKYDRGGKIAPWITRIGRILWGLVEVAVPRSIPKIVVQHWLKLLFLFEGLLIVGGILFVSPTVRDLGWKALGATLAVQVAILLLTDLMLNKVGKWRKTKAVLISAVVLLLLLGIYEVWMHLGSDIGIWLDRLRGIQRTQ
jgi:patatin-related protein